MKWRNRRKQKNWKIYKNGVRTDAPKLAKKDTNVDGACLCFLRVFDGWPRNHYKNSALRARPEEQPRNSQFIKIHKTPWPFKYPWFFGDNARPWSPHFCSVSWGRQKWGSMIHPQTASNGVQLCTRRQISLHVKCLVSKSYLVMFFDWWVRIASIYL